MAMRSDVDDLHAGPGNEDGVARLFNDHGRRVHPFPDDHRAITMLAEPQIHTDLEIKPHGGGGRHQAEQNDQQNSTSAVHVWFPRK